MILLVSGEEKQKHGQNLLFWSDKPDYFVEISKTWDKTEYVYNNLLPEWWKWIIQPMGIPW